MSAPACCARAAPVQRTFVRRGLRALPWLAPGVGLVLLPKCPVCLAAWLAVATGAGVTAATASGVRLALTVVCLAAALFATVRLLRGAARSRNALPRRVRAHATPEPAPPASPHG